MARRFRLERLLRVRERVRQLRQNEAAALAAEVRRLERAREALIDTRDRRARGEADALARAPLDAETFVVGRSYDRGLAEDAERCSADHGTAASALEAKRGEVTAARRDERKLERLRDLHQQREAEEEARAAERLLDEIGARGRRRARAAEDDDEEES